MYDAALKQFNPFHHFFNVHSNSYFFQWTVSATSTTTDGLWKVIKCIYAQKCATVTEKTCLFED